jgi:zinc D-Ala-D-Ala carboxypeptidase
MKFSQIRLISTFVLLVALIALTVIQISSSLIRSREPEVLTQSVPVAIAEESIIVNSPPFVSIGQATQTPNVVISPSPLIIPKSPPVIIQPNKPALSLPKQYGHLPYQEAPLNTLKIVGKYYDRFEKLHSEATIVFKEMQAKAKLDGIGIVPISGFRTVADQELLFKRQINRQQGSVEAAARLSAPAGYSEHHTGYAIDIGEESSPNTDLKLEFEYTAAYSWLKNKAESYRFILSFPKNNSQGVSFEPWHWRYVGSSRAAEIFKRQ